MLGKGNIAFLKASIHRVLDGILCGMVKFLHQELRVVPLHQVLECHQPSQLESLKVKGRLIALEWFERGERRKGERKNKKQQKKKKQ